MELPKELRLQVYEYLFVPNEPTWYPARRLRTFVTEMADIGRIVMLTMNSRGLFGPKR